MTPASNILSSSLRKIWLCNEAIRLEKYLIGLELFNSKCLPIGTCDGLRLLTDGTTTVLYVSSFPRKSWASFCGCESLFSEAFYGRREDKDIKGFVFFFYFTLLILVFCSKSGRSRLLQFSGFERFTPGSSRSPGRNANAYVSSS